MKKALSLLSLLLLCGSNAWAADIAGKWGLGAGIANFATDITVLHGRSEKSAWLFDLQLGQYESAAESHGTTPYLIDRSTNRNGWRIAGGPGLRHLTRPQSDFSPYWDLFLHGNYAHDHYFNDGSNDEAAWGVDTGLAIGAEYFTKWHFSAAVHTRVASFSWEHRNSTRSYGLNESYESTGHNQGASVGVAPQLFVRVYF
ncbi:MAG: hypothetical protein HYR73_02220 [Candidatus Eisenbacteria bacterium]|nr:hypothetical protein [Candidatus Eisenbacteria bacterium]